MSGSRNRRAGNGYELSIVHKFNNFGFNMDDDVFLHAFPTLATTRAANKRMDIMKIDITTEDDRDHKLFGLSIQAKNTISNVNYSGILNQMKEGVDKYGGIPLIYHKHTKRIKNNFMPMGEYVIMFAKDFEQLLLKKKALEYAFEETRTYFDSFPEDIQEILLNYYTHLDI